MDAAAAAAEQPPRAHRWRRIGRIGKAQTQPHQQQKEKVVVMDEEAADSAAPTAISSRKRFAMELSSDEMMDDTSGSGTALNGSDGLVSEDNAVLSERRRALFEPLEPNMNGKRPSAESLLPPPDFDAASYPKGWLIGKKRKLVNVDVVESMRRIAVQEMNRKDREIDGLNEQLEEDSRVLEHLQIQLLEEKSKRTSVERENAMLQDQINMLMDMLHENENMADDGSEEP